MKLLCICMLCIMKHFGYLQACLPVASCFTIIPGNAVIWSSEVATRYQNHLEYIAAAYPKKSAKPVHAGFQNMVDLMSCTRSARLCGSRKGRRLLIDNFKAKFSNTTNNHLCLCWATLQLNNCLSCPRDQHAHPSLNNSY